jgi:hypothetical protein
VTGRIFLLSPANCGGTRAKQALSPNAGFALAAALRSADGAPLGDLFSFVSGLYFRGKLTYARRFAATPPGLPGSYVMAPGAGLRPSDALITADHLRAMGQIDIESAAFVGPLRRDAAFVDEHYQRPPRVVLLGSVASGKYIDTLLAVFGERLMFPSTFVGRGDMSRGGLLLRASRSGQELDYAPIAGAVLHGTRPPKLPRVKSTAPAAPAGPSNPEHVIAGPPRRATTSSRRRPS